MIASSWIAIYLAMIVAAERPDKAEVSGGPYCGVYCVYTTAKMCGRTVAFEDLLSQNYVGSYKGSTVAELRQAIESIGLTATRMSVDCGNKVRFASLSVTPIA